MDDWRRDLDDALAGTGTVLRRDEPLARHTSFRIGGCVEALAEPGDMAGLARVLEFCRRAVVEWRVLGWGSNVLVSDQGLAGVAVRLHGSLVRVEPGRENTVVAGAGAGLDDLVSAAEAAGLSGLEFLAGIPGTVGGALVTNAGAFGHSIAEFIVEVSGLDEDGRAWQVAGSDLVPRYRAPLIDDGLVATQVVLRLAPGRAETPAAAIRKQRREKHPTEPSAGSYFKNPEQDGQRIPAGRLIEQCGLKGKSIGGARVSEKHANFIVNAGGARFADVYELAEIVKATVEEQTGIFLDEEVRIMPGNAASTPRRQADGKS